MKSNNDLPVDKLPTTVVPGASGHAAMHAQSNALLRRFQATKIPETILDLSDGQAALNGKLSLSDLEPITDLVSRAEFTALQDQVNSYTKIPTTLSLDLSAGDGQVTVAANGGVGGIKYRLYQGTTATGTPIATSFPVTVTGLTNGTAVSFVAQAENFVGTVTSSVVTVTPAKTPTTVFTHDWSADTLTTGGGSAPAITDPSSVFKVASISGTPALGLNAGSITADGLFFAWSPTNFGANVDKVSARMLARRRSDALTGATYQFPRLVVAANSATANPTERYEAFPAITSGTAAKWRIVKWVGGVASVVAEQSSSSNAPSVNWTSELTFNPKTGALELLVAGASILTYTDSSPLTGTRCGVAMRALVADTAGSATQGVTSFTVGTI